MANPDLFHRLQCRQDQTLNVVLPSGEKALVQLIAGARIMLKKLFCVVSWPGTPGGLAQLGER